MRAATLRTHSRRTPIGAHAPANPASAAPILLFTTTEILNQRLSDQWTRLVFGVGAPRKPFLALLDEIHTYEGTGGAQARSHFGVGGINSAPVHWAGLSATSATRHVSSPT